jgi:hypothetical protein
MGLILQIVLLTIGLIGISASVFAIPRSAIRSLFIVVSSVLFLAGLILTILTYANPPTSEEIASRVASLLRGAPMKLNHPLDEKLPGFGSGMMVETKDITEMRRKYHFDFHTPDGAKAAFYLSASNRYAFSVTDIHGEPYTLDIPLGSNGIPFEKWSYVFCEAGTASSYAYLRALVNGSEVARRDFDFPIDLGSRQWMPTIGADANGKNPGAFMLSEIGVYSMTLTDAELKTIAENALQFYKPDQ